MTKAAKRSIPERTPVDAETHAEAFQKTRDARRSELMEDYIELIAALIDAEGEARQVEVARRLGVAQPTVAKMIRRLTDEGLILKKPYRGIFLTETGRQLASECRKRHEVVETFLRFIGVSAEVARHDAEGIEHYVSAETLQAFERVVAKG